METPSTSRCHPRYTLTLTPEARFGARFFREGSMLQHQTEYVYIYER
jgi:hypothetical protein